MNKKIIGAIIAIGVLVVANLSCATGNNDYGVDFAGESFLAWMEKNAPNATLLEEGIYIEYFERQKNWEELPEIEADSSWLKLNYTGYNLQGSAFITRDSSEGAWLGLTSSPRSRFVDDYIFNQNTSKLCAGLQSGLNYMRAGDSARIYIPTALGYGASIASNTTYTVSTINYVGVPIYFDIALKDIVNDPYEKEIELLNQWVAENWGMTEEDTLKTGFYIRTITEGNPKDSITVDSTVTYDYSSYFLDGQLYKTTLEDVAVEWGYYSSSDNYYSVTVSSIEFSSTTVTNSVYREALLEMCYGEVAEVAAISLYGIGFQGDQTSDPEVLPYESMLFSIEAHEYVVEEEEGEE